MKKNIKNKKYTMKEAVSYFILGYKKYEQDREQNGLRDIIKNIVEVIQEHIDKEEITRVNSELLNKINFDWLLSSNDLIAYATCIFYVLINREIQITDEKIVREFLKELHTHHPKRTIQEAELILERAFPELLND